MFDLIFYENDLPVNVWKRNDTRVILYNSLHNVRNTSWKNPLTEKKNEQKTTDEHLENRGARNKSVYT